MLLMLMMIFFLSFVACLCAFCEMLIRIVVLNKSIGKWLQILRHTLYLSSLSVYAGTYVCLLNVA